MHCISQTRHAPKLPVVDYVTVNLNQPAQAKSLSGFLGGLQNPKYPNREDVRKLQPKLMRTSFTERYDESYKLAGRVHLIVSDLWKQKDNDNSGQIDMYNPRPYLDPTYTDYLAKMFDWGYNNGNIRPGIVWECWNEPENEYSKWQLSDFFETYKVTYQALLDSKIGSTAQIAGPSFAWFSEEKMTAFFDYCLENNLEVNVITWHEIWYPAESKPLSKLQDHVAFVREHFMENPKYASLNMQSIEINEIIWPADKNRPSEIAGYLQNLEDAGVDYACKTCFYHTTNTDEQGNMADGIGVPPCELGSCDDASFNDLFTIGYDSEHYVNLSNECNPLPGNENKPKSAWWVYRLYADGVPFRVKSSNTEPASHVIASSKIQPYPDTVATNTAQVLVGYSNQWPLDYAPVTGTYSVRINNLATLNPQATEFTVKICEIPFNGANSYNKAEDNTPLLQPVLVSTAYYLADSKNGITVNFTATTDALYQITISAVE
ncbi:hypothetical protein AM493_05205 [Flavobacterium akiainvivens]|uniref:Beta-xylosidase n=1 Tax=Flavobacterium akiainvivens TaxID=1202724 RepID=A0A0M8M9R0_9FLAO|nr:hypothetical protein AM493_05205 [Flavobacterium akiainvivens]